MSTVTIITPCLNPGDALETCVRSVADQTYERIEHIVVDGGSTDGTPERLQRSGLRFVSEPDRGQSDAINKGIAMATGEYVGWLNADDRLMPDAVAAVVKAMESSGAGWAYGQVEVVDADSRRIWTPPANPVPHLFDMGKGGVIPQPGSLIRMDVMRELGPLDTDLNLAMDFDLWIRLILKGVRCVYVPRVLAVFEIHSDSKTGREGLAPFFLEEALVWRKAGNPRMADIALGRAAAHRSRELGSSLSDALAGLAVMPTDTGLALAGARTESGLLGRWTHLLHPSPWTTNETRRRLLTVFRKVLAGSK